MDSRPVEFLSRFREGAEDFVRERYPSEAGWFGSWWDAVMARAVCLESQPGGPELRQAATDLGFADEEALDLQVPKVIATLSAAVVHLIAFGGRVSQGAAGDTLMTYGKEFGLSYSDALNVRDFFSGKLAKELSDLRIADGPGRWGKDEIIVVDSKKGGRPAACSEEERWACKARKETYDLFVDDLDREVEVRGGLVQLGLVQRRLLMYILVHAGRYYTLEDVREDVWRGHAEDPHRQALWRLREALGEAFNEVVDSREGRFYVAGGLSFCLIARAGEYRFLDRIVLRGETEPA